MKLKKLLLLLLMITAFCDINAQKIMTPGIKTPTTFAILVDETSYEKVKEAIDAYKQSIEKDGLGTYLIINKWKNPEEIRSLLITLHNDKKSPLEGCVLIGDIPIPMLRDAQHLTSAFKMDQRRDWKKSSVPSDRYYDDFGLKFDFLKQDKDIPSYYYYSLRADSKQYLSPDIYSARIKPLKLEGTDKYELLREYLTKVVKEKKENAHNIVDHLSMGRGHGYNSEDPGVWAGEQLALREQFPQLFQPGNSVKFFEFDAQFPMKEIYLNEVQNPDLDIMLFHHHGSPKTQYINGYENVSAPMPSIENVKRFLRGKIPSMAKKEGKEAAIAYYMKGYDVPRNWCESAFDPQKIEEDSLFNLTLDIHTTDIHNLKPNARFIMFDACFNGSFYEKDYIAGAYVFAKGKTIATQGATVNTIQDKWPDEMLGLLGAGMRIGQFNRLVCFLENHIMGDPTFHFANNILNFDINHAVVLKKGNINFWKKQLNNPLPDIQALALRELADADYPEIPTLLKESYFNSDLFVVRLTAVRLLALNYSEHAIPVLKAAINDSYELIRRFAAEYIEKNASPELIPAFIDAYIQRGHEVRLGFKINSGLAAFDFKSMREEIEKQTAKRPFYSTKRIELLKKKIDQEEANSTKNLKAIGDTATKASEARLEIIRFRNHPSIMAINPLLEFIADNKHDMQLRITACETLGWFSKNYRKADIIAGLRQIKTDNQDLQNEINKTIKRLKDKNR